MRFDVVHDTKADTLLFSGEITGDELEALLSWQPPHVREAIAKGLQKECEALLVLALAVLFRASEASEARKLAERQGQTASARAEIEDVLAPGWYRPEHR